jgi:intein-encoded DNA endonuclease-like protein
MSENILGAGNQQGSYLIGENNPSETTRRSPFLPAMNKREIYAYVQGAMHDASLNKGKRVRFGQKYPEWLETIKSLLCSVGVNSWMYKEGKDRNFYILETVCKDLDFAFDPRTLKTEGEKVAYIRGFFDAEGGIPRTNGEFYVQLVQKDFRKIEVIKEILSTLGIQCGKIHNPSKRVDPDYWRVFVSRKSHKRFAEIIGSWHPIKANIFFKRMMI